METREYRTMDKAAWGEGPWLNEPDKKQWPDPATGLPCLAVRNPNAGNWCGYVGVPPGHVLHGKDYNDVEVEVHGGLTFSDACSPSETPERGICHVAGEGEPDHVWWFGFDCAHGGDQSPGYTARYSMFGRDGTYRTLEYVEGHVTALARQLAARD